MSEENYTKFQKHRERKLSLSLTYIKNIYSSAHLDTSAVSDTKMVDKCERIGFLKKLNYFIKMDY